MSERPLLSTPILIVTLAGAVAIFALSLVLSLSAPNEAPRTGSDTRSISALGHAGLYELLKRSDIPVSRSELKGLVAPTGNDDVLVMAEPNAGLSSDEILRFGRARRALLVLPKRTGTADNDNPGWVKSTTPIDIGQVAAIAQMVTPKVDIVRTDPPQTPWFDSLGVQPSFTDTVQYIRSDELTPIVADGNNMLVAQYRDGDRLTWILADPDIIENHGIAKGQNAAFALALLNRLRNNDGSVIFDETIHGMVNVVADPLRKLVEFPLVIASILAVAAAVLLLWGTLERFGKPAAVPPAFDFGKRRLIATSAALLERSGHQVSVMRRYVELTLRDIGRDLHAPRELGDDGLADWLDARGRARGIEANAGEILARAEKPGSSRGQEALATFAAAGDIHRLKDRISHGA